MHTVAYVDMHTQDTHIFTHIPAYNQYTHISMCTHNKHITLQHEYLAEQGKGQRCGQLA